MDKIIEKVLLELLNSEDYLTTDDKLDKFKELMKSDDKYKSVLQKWFDIFHEQVFIETEKIYDETLGKNLSKTKFKYCNVSKQYKYYVLINNRYVPVNSYILEESLKNHINYIKAQKQS